MDEQSPEPGLGHIIERGLGIAVVGAVLLGIVATLWPFATGIMFGAILAIALWPVRDWMVGKGIRPAFTATLLIILVVAAVVLPTLAITPGLVGAINAGMDWASAALMRAPATPPDWILDLPLIGGPTGVASLETASGAVRSVAYGVVGTSVWQGVVAAVGFAIAGVPASTLLGFLTFVFSISQVLGPLVIVTWVGASWWLFEQGETAWGIFMAVWGILVISSSDNLIRPLLIKRGVDMPLSIVILGVFGGFVAFGFLGLFIGPVLLAVGLVMLRAWRAEELAVERR